MELSDLATGAPEDHGVKDATKDTDIARSADAKGFDPDVCAPEVPSHLSPIVENEAEDDSLNGTDRARGAERTIDAKDEADSRQGDRGESESERYNSVSESIEKRNNETRSTWDRHKPYWIPSDVRALIKI